jgi:hypothetical protein
MEPQPQRAHHPAQILYLAQLHLMAAAVAAPFLLRHLVQGLTAAALVVQEVAVVTEPGQH